MKRLRAVETFEITHGGVVFTFRIPSASESVSIYDLLLLPMRELGREGVAVELGEIAQAAAATVGLLWADVAPDMILVTARPDMSEATTRESLLSFGRYVLAELSDAGLSFADVQALSTALAQRLTGSGEAAEVKKVADFTAASAG